MPEAFGRNVETAEADVERTRRNGEIVAASLARNRQDLMAQAQDPSFSNKLWASFKGLAALGIDFIPVVGPGQKFWQARNEYNKYSTADTSPEAEKAREVARERCVIAILELGLDIGTGGGSGLMPDEVITWLNRFKLMLKAQRHGEKVSGFEKVVGLVDIPGHFSKLMLKSDTCRSFIDWSLKSGSRQDKLLGPAKPKKGPPEE